MTPSTARAGEYGTFVLAVEMDGIALGAGARISVRPLVRVANYWSGVQDEYPERDNYAVTNVPGDVETELRVENGWNLVLTVTKGTLPAAGTVEFVYGDTAGGSPGLKTGPLAGKAELQVEYSEGEGREPCSLPPVFVSILPGPAVAILAHTRAPSATRKRELSVRALDEFGNTVTDAGASLDLETVPGLEQETPLAFPGEGKAHCRTEFELPETFVCGCFEVSLSSPPLQARSDPIDVRRDVYWGDLHCHTRIGQALETPEFLYEYGRDDGALDFMCHVEHYAGTPARWFYGKPGSSVAEEEMASYIEDSWARQKELIEHYAEPGRFVPFLGYEWASNIYGHMHVIYRDVDEDVVYPHDFYDREDTPAKLFEKLADRKALVIPHHPSWPVNNGGVSGMDWSFYDERLVRLVEMCSKHGVSEYFGCPDAIPWQAADGAVRAALTRGYRLGFVGSTDSHASRPGSYGLTGDLWGRFGGITAVFAESLDRESIFDALKNRLCYATTGARMLLDFSVNGMPMGSELTVPAGQARAFSMKAMGTGRLQHVELVRNNEVIHRYTCGGPGMEEVCHDWSPPAGEACYYMRVMQADGHQGWSSPIWIDPS